MRLINALNKLFGYDCPSTYSVLIGDNEERGLTEKQIVDILYLYLNHYRAPVEVIRGAKRAQFLNASGNYQTKGHILELLKEM